MAQNFKPNEIRACIHLGDTVDVVLKKDQPTGRLTRGIVKEILTNSKTHPRGIKVLLTDGRVGRVQAIAANTQGTELTAQAQTAGKGLPLTGWKCKAGESRFAASKGKWMQGAERDWPLFCSVKDCCNLAVAVCVAENEQAPCDCMVPLCRICSSLSLGFSVGDAANLVPTNEGK